MKKLQLKITRGTQAFYFLVFSQEEIKNTLKQEYSWHNIYKNHNHSAALFEIDENGDAIGEPIETLDLPEHDDYSCEPMIDEDGGDTANLYSRLGEEAFTEDFDGQIAAFCETINSK